MLKTIYLLCLAGKLAEVNAAVTVQDSEYSSCRGCASGSNKMCKSKELSGPTDDSVVCCTPTVYEADGITVLSGNSHQEYCQSSTSNQCSASFSGRLDSWFTFCPQAAPKNCGG